MRVDNIRWHPVRLGLTREGSNAWRVSRGGRVVGEIRRHPEGWVSIPVREALDGDGHHMHVLDRASRTQHSSFVSAVLKATRLRGIWASSDGPQDFGLVHMLRINVATRWYTVINDPMRGDLYLYEDFTVRDEMSDEQQGVLRRVLVEARRRFGRKP